MVLRCSNDIKKNILYGLTLILTISFFLNLCIFIPVYLESPYNINHLQRTLCNIKSVDYVNNYCNNNDDDLFTLTYKEQWKNCIIIILNYTTTQGQSCKYIIPDVYDDYKSALINYKNTFKDNGVYSCIINTIDNICFPDKYELIIILSVLGVNLLLLIIFLYITYNFYKKGKIYINSINNNDINNI